MSTKECSHMVYMSCRQEMVLNESKRNKRDGTREPTWALPQALRSTVALTSTALSPSSYDRVLVCAMYIMYVFHEEPRRGAVRHWGPLLPQGSVNRPDSSIFTFFHLFPYRSPRHL